MLKIFISTIFLLLMFNFHNQLFASDAFCPSSKYVTSAEVDLNGDEKIDKVTISLPDIPEEEWSLETGDFELKVNDASIKGKLGYTVDGFVIVDIDKNDKFKEIAVHTGGESSDDEYLIYWYDGKSLRKMNWIARWPVFPGNGIVYVDNWMGFWSKRERYVLDRKKRVLKLVPQELYYIGQKVKVKKSFPLMQKRKGEKVLARLRLQSEILIIACAHIYSGAKYSENWYLIKSSTGLLGWARLKSFRYKVEGLPLAD